MTNNLRLILLIIGCCLILAIYLWEIFRKNKNRKKADILNAIDDTPDLPITLNHDFAEEDYSKAITDLSELSAHLKNDHIKITTDEIKQKIVTKTNKNIIKDTAEISQDGKILDDILVFYITARSNSEFSGMTINKALDKVGMRHGDMDIFHHFGDNGRIDDFDDSSLDSRRANQPLFSVANMYEPGIFILEEMANLRTKGIAAFMYKPNSIYGYKIFENIFFHNVQRIAEFLDGEIRASNHELLNEMTLTSIRDKLRLYAMKDFLKNDPK